ncbi:lipase member H-A-like isoform X2 [Anthonomus grandis grandis]|uniref:lipase member H-A-like isoform X2 n=1 Tax=Anthonomus grandis grandis TaxID=2921223 RepID=UPI002166BDCE|nr:lipase member H-A-like isoform X2 [Anthonomus grandis grandis]
MSLGFSLFCVLASLPGPPQKRISNLTLQAYTINKRHCPEFDPYRDSIFHLYTRKNVAISSIMIPFHDQSLANSGMDFSRKTIIFFHGFTESFENDDAQSIKNAYLTRGDYNVILVQNERILAGLDYITAASNCKPIARYSAYFIDYLVSKGLHLNTLHVIGLSLGGQIAGMTGQFVRSGRLPRITALDPAGPLFNNNPIEERLDSSDADFVDVIYTNSGVFGMKYSVGHLNFWPNGGTKQPGCKLYEILQRYGVAINWLVFCHHYRSYQLYVESIRNPHKFPSRKCKSYVLYTLGFCNTEDVAYMGINANSRS